MDRPPGFLTRRGMSVAVIDKAAPAAESRRRTKFSAGQPTAYVAMAILAVILGLALVVPIVAGSAQTANSSLALRAPSAGHLFGTDRYGRDVFLRCMAGARIDLVLALGVSAVGLVAGSLFGAISGAYGRWIDAILMRFTDILLAVPAFMLALIITASLGNSVWYAAIAICVAYVPVFIRLARAKTLEVRSSDYIAASRLSGTPTRSIVVGHVLPNIIRYPFVQSSLIASWVVLDLAGLSFLGVGVRPPTPEWGAMIADEAGDVLVGAWWTSLFPGLMILICATCFQLIGSWLDRRLR